MAKRIHNQDFAPIIAMSDADLREPFVNQHQAVQCLEQSLDGIFALPSRQNQYLS